MDNSSFARLRAHSTASRIAQFQAHSDSRQSEALIRKGRTHAAPRRNLGRQGSVHPRRGLSLAVSVGMHLRNRSFSHQLEPFLIHFVFHFPDWC